MKSIVLLLLRSYHRISPVYHSFLKNMFGMSSVCRFTPTCSEYTYKAVEKYGAVKGLGLGFKRLLRCNPLFKGGHDPLP